MELFWGEGCPRGSAAGFSCRDTGRPGCTQEAAILDAATGSAGSYPKAPPRLQHDGQFHTPGHAYTATAIRTHVSWLASHARINTWEPERPRGGQGRSGAVRTELSTAETARRGRPPTVTQSTDHALPLARAASHTVGGRPRDQWAGMWGAGAPKKTLSWWRGRLTKPGTGARDPEMTLSVRF